MARWCTKKGPDDTGGYHQIIMSWCDFVCCHWVKSLTYNHYLAAVWFIKMITHGIEVISNSEVVIESLATLVGHSRTKYTSYCNICVLTYLVLCVVLIWLCFIIINQRRGIAVVLADKSETWSPFVTRLRAIRDSFLLMPTASSIGPRHMTREEHSLPNHSFEVSLDTNELVNPTQGTGREIILQ